MHACLWLYHLVLDLSYSYLELGPGFDGHRTKAICWKSAGIASTWSCGASCLVPGSVPFPTSLLVQISNWRDDVHTSAVLVVTISPVS